MFVSSIMAVLSTTLSSKSFKRSKYLVRVQRSELAASSYELAVQKANKTVEIHPSRFRITSASEVQTILAALQVGPAEGCMRFVNMMSLRPSRTASKLQGQVTAVNRITLEQILAFVHRRKNGHLNKYSCMRRTRGILYT